MDSKDYIAKYDLDGVSMGYIPGSNKLLFIKTGQGGSIYGDGNKYLNLAVEVNKKYGFSVIVSSTFDDSPKAHKLDMMVVDKLFVNQGCQIYYLGVSKGGLVGMWYGSENENITRMVAINPPLMINYHNKTRPALDKLGAKLVVLVGDRDPSYDYVPFVKGHARVEVLFGVDHNLARSPLSLLQIVEQFLLIDDQ